MNGDGLDRSKIRPEHLERDSSVHRMVEARWAKARRPITPKPKPRDEREGPSALDDAARELGVTPAGVSTKEP